MNIKPGGIDANLAPQAFGRTARHLLHAAEAFVAPDGGRSPVPYFLFCRAIELAAKAAHLNAMSQADVKTSFGHDLTRSYSALPRAMQTLTSTQHRVLKDASAIYAGKGFEYFEPGDALSAYARFPHLLELQAVARQLVSQSPNI